MILPEDANAWSMAGRNVIQCATIAINTKFTTHLTFHMSVLQINDGVYVWKTSDFFFEK